MSPQSPLRSGSPQSPLRSRGPQSPLRNPQNQSSLKSSLPSSGGSLLHPGCILLCRPRPDLLLCLCLQAVFHSTGLEHRPYPRSACCLLLVPCALLSIVCPLPSCYLIIFSLAPPVSPSLPSFVSLFSLLVSVVLCWSVVFRRVCVMLNCTTVLCLPACLPACFFPFRAVSVYLFFIMLLKTRFPCI